MGNHVEFGDGDSLEGSNQQFAAIHVKNISFIPSWICLAELLVQEIMLPAAVSSGTPAS